jgi:hypothetical protein
VGGGCVLESGGRIQIVLGLWPFKVRLTEHPVVLDKGSGAKALVGRFDTRKK